MRIGLKTLGLAAATAGIGVLGTAGVVMAAGGFDNPSANEPPHIIKFGINRTSHDGPGCGLQWDGTDVTATVKHGDDGPGNDGCIAGQKINNLAAVFPGGRSVNPVWVGEPKSDIANFGHGPFKGWAAIVGTDASPPAEYDFILDNTSHDGSAIYLSYTDAP